MRKILWNHTHSQILTYLHTHKRVLKFALIKLQYIHTYIHPPPTYVLAELLLQRWEWGWPKSCRYLLECMYKYVHICGCVGNGVGLIFDSWVYKVRLEIIGYQLNNCFSAFQTAFMAVGQTHSPIDCCLTAYKRLNNFNTAAK